MRHLDSSCSYTAKSCTPTRTPAPATLSRSPSTSRMSGWTCAGRGRSTATPPQTSCADSCTQSPPTSCSGSGGDTIWPTAVVGYSIQARRGLGPALEAEVAEGDLTEAEAITVARRLMHDNQYACFDIEGARGGCPVARR